MKIAIITGASSGMGREMSIQISEKFRGLDEIWLIARREERLIELKKQLNVKARVIPMDVTDIRDRDDLKELLTKISPKVRILVNCAGIGKMGSVVSQDTQLQSSMIETNCTALTAITSIVLPFMSRNSRIIQFASAAAFMPEPYFTVYSSTKAYVLSYSRALGQELRYTGIYVTAVCPGPVDTEFMDLANSGDDIPSFKKMFLADPKKVVKLALTDSMLGKPLSIYGWEMKAFYIISRILPPSFIIPFSGLLFKE